MAYLYLYIFTRINGKKLNLFHSEGNVHLGIKLMKSVNPHQGYMAVWLKITLMTYSNYALMSQIMFIAQHFLLSKRSLLFTQLQIQSEFWHVWWEINNLSHCCCHLCELFTRSFICPELDWDVRQQKENTHLRAWWDYKQIILHQPKETLPVLGQPSQDPLGNLSCASSWSIIV